MNSKSKPRTIHKRSNIKSCDVIEDGLEITHANTTITLEGTRPLAIHKHAEFITNTIFRSRLLTIVTGNQFL